MTAYIDLVFAEVRETAPCTVADIALNTGLSQSSVRRALGHLERAGAVESDNYQRGAMGRVYLLATEPTE